MRIAIVDDFAEDRALLRNRLERQLQRRSVQADFFEFETKEDADNFAAPDWFTRDVSMDGAYHNSALSSMNEEQRLAFMARVFGH